MKKILIILLLTIIIIAILLGLIIFINKSVTGNMIKEQNPSESDTIHKYSYTKAICNSSNYCQDYEIICENNQTKSVSPVTGAVVQFDDNWQDPRAERDRERLC